VQLSATLSRYLSRQYAFWLTSVFVALIGVAFLFDVVEGMRRAKGKSEATLGIVLQMSLYKMPHLVEKLLPFVVLFGAMFAFWRLARANEVVVARSAGVSAWQFLLPAIAVTLFLGVVHVTVFNPFAAITLAKFERLESQFLNRSTSLLSVSKNGLWLRQADQGGQSVIHAMRVANDDMELRDVIIFLFEGADKFAGRIDAESARLEEGYWNIKNAWISAPNRAAKFVASYRLKTDLTITKIQDSFASPETMSFWELPEFILALEAAGFSGHRHRLYLYTLYALPVLLCAMVLIAATFTLRVNRRTGAVFAIIGGTFFSFVLYFLSDVVHALGLSANVPTLLAAWTPASVALMLGLAMLFHVEDG
jgi:lipopolysaccharide export system permease protein